MNAGSGDAPAMTVGRLDGRTVRRSLVALLFLTAGPAVRLAAQCPDGTPPPCPGTRSTAPSANSVAVLPFDNLSRDTADAYLARDLTDEITTRLIKVERLVVTSPTVVRRYRGSNEPRAVAQSLRVAYLVSGSVRRDGDRLRISVELLRARDGVAPWSDVYNQRDTSMLDIQSRIAQAVAAAIAGRLLPQERQQLATRPTRDPRAYDHFARGRYQLAARTTRSLLRATREFEAAARLDSTFGTALAGASVAYSALSGTYYDSATVGQPRDSLSATAARLARQALRVDSTSAEAWSVAAGWAPLAARRGMLERALAIDPHNADVLHSYYYVLTSVGDTAEARRVLRQSIALDPTQTVPLLALGTGYLLDRNYREAARWLDSAVSFDPEAHFYYFDRALARLHAGDTATLRADVAEIRRRDRAMVADALALLFVVWRGDSAAMRSGAAALRTSAAGLACPVNFDCLQAAMAMSAAGDRDGALTLLERTSPMSGRMADWLRMAEFDTLREEARFQRIVDASRRQQDQ